MNDYELVTILDPEINNEDVPDRIGRITSFIETRGGEIQNIDQWGRRRLAYPIARRIEGTYVITLFRLEPQSADGLEASLRLSEDVLRHLLVRHTPAESAAALAASQRRRQRIHGEERPESAPTESAEQVEMAATDEAVANREPDVEQESETSAVEAEESPAPEAAAGESGAGGEDAKSE